MDTIESELREKLTENGAGLVGFADIGGISSLADKKFKCGISVAVPLNKTIVSENLDGPTRDYYNEYKRVMELLSELGITAASILARRGFSAIILDPSGDLDLERLTTPLPHKAVATMAGLGWIEKNGVLVTKEFGPSVMLVSVLTDAELTSCLPVDESLCGSCTACAEACPADAINGVIWQRGMEREVLLDAFRCEKIADERGKRVGVNPDETVCGICISACPLSR
jgi:epoxyqueuosine reductase QueG